MRRITYVSRYTKPLSDAELLQLGEAATVKNRHLGVTGTLLTSGGLFYQVIEGPDRAVGDLFTTIQGDQRHTDLLVLRSEEETERRLFPDWSMQTINLDAAAHVRLLPLKALVKTVHQQQHLIDNMLWAIERTLQHEMKAL